MQHCCKNHGKLNAQQSKEKVQKLAKQELKHLLVILNLYQTNRQGIKKKEACNFNRLLDSPDKSIDGSL